MQSSINYLSNVECGVRIVSTTWMHGYCQLWGFPIRNSTKWGCIQLWNTFFFIGTAVGTLTFQAHCAHQHGQTMDMFSWKKLFGNRVHNDVDGSDTVAIIHVVLISRCPYAESAPTDSVRGGDVVWPTIPFVWSTVCRSRFKPNHQACYYCLAQYFLPVHTQQQNVSMTFSICRIHIPMPFHTFAVPLNSSSPRSKRACMAHSPHLLSQAVGQPFDPSNECAGLLRWNVTA